MAVVEIHIENDKVHKIEGQDVYVYVYDHDIKETTTMIFKKQEEIYENWTHMEPIRVSSTEDTDSEGEIQNIL